MYQKMISIVCACLLILAGALCMFAQDGAQWKVGDKVEILNLSKEWSAGTIIGTVDWAGKLMYRVQLDDPNASTVYFNHTPPADIRKRGGQVVTAANQPAEIGQQVNQPARAGEGARVDVYYNQTQGKNHATIIQTENNRYKVHYIGCTQTWDEWVDKGLIREFSTISSTSPEIRFLVGKWSLTAVAVNGNANGTVVAWGNSPGIQIKTDGTYVWYQDGGRPAVKGTWTTDSKIQGADSGTQKYDGILVKDADGQDWKVVRWMRKDDDGNHVEVQRMCSGISDIGKRVL